MALIHLQNIIKHYRAFVGLCHMFLDLNGEEFLVQLGPSGSGKTTTRMMVAGSCLRPRRGIVPQGYARHPNKSIYENIRPPLRPTLRPAAIPISSRILHLLCQVSPPNMGMRCRRLVGWAMMAWATGVR